MKFILYASCSGGYKMTNEENYNRRIQNARQIMEFKDFDTIEEVIEYCTKYLNITKDEIIIK